MLVFQHSPTATLFYLDCKKSSGFANKGKFLKQRTCSTSWIVRKQYECNKELCQWPLVRRHHGPRSSPTPSSQIAFQSDIARTDSSKHYHVPNQPNPIRVPHGRLSWPDATRLRNETPYQALPRRHRIPSLSSNPHRDRQDPRLCLPPLQKASGDPARRRRAAPCGGDPGQGRRTAPHGGDATCQATELEDLGELERLEATWP